MWGRNKKLEASRETGLSRNAIDQLIEIQQRAGEEDKLHLAFVSELVCNRDLAKEMFRDYADKEAKRIAGLAAEGADERLRSTAKLLRVKKESPLSRFGNMAGLHNW